MTGSDHAPEAYWMLVLCTVKQHGVRLDERF